MKDFIGQEIREGDRVAYINSYGPAKELLNGTVTGFTPEFVKIDGDRKSPEKLIVVTLLKELQEMKLHIAGQVYEGDARDRGVLERAPDPVIGENDWD